MMISNSNSNSNSNKNNMNNRQIKVVISALIGILIGVAIVQVASWVFFKVEKNPSDVNNDGTIDLTDVSIVLSNIK